jgi:hypothetical protein
MLGRRSIGVLLSLSVLACTHNSPPGQDGYRSQVITEDEVVASKAANAYDVIKKVRANFFSYRGRTTLIGTSSPDPTVYVDEQPFGPISSLRTIPADEITEIRLYRAWEATTKYGMGNMGGVILVTTRK